MTEPSTRKKPARGTPAEPNTKAPPAPPVAEQGVVPSRRAQPPSSGRSGAKKG